MAKVVAVASNRRWDLLLFWGFLAALAIVRSGHPDERDAFWQIRAGMENLAGLPLARPDTWTWSGVEGNWYPNSPLWNMLLALSYGAAGIWGLFVLSAATILALVMVTDALGRRLGARPLPGLLGLLVVYSAAFPMISSRATLAIQLLLLTAVYLALRLGDRLATMAPAVLNALVLASALALSTLGNWLHLSFLLLGPAMGAVWALIWLLTPGLSGRRRLVLIIAGGIGWLLGPVLSPYGLAVGLARARAVQEACEGVILEWASPFNPLVPPKFFIMLTVALVLAVGAAGWLYRRWRAGAPVRDLAALVAIGVPTAFAGLVAIRFLGVSLLVLAPVAAAAATRAADRLRSTPTPARLPTGLAARLRDYGTGRFWRIALTATLVVLSPGVVLLGAEHGDPPERAMLARLPVGCRLFTGSVLASVSVLLRPDVPVWMDGRLDFAGRQMILDGYGYQAGTMADPVPPGSTCVLWTDDAAGAGLRARLAASADWRRDSRDGTLELWLPVAAG
jgi:hypothetical protein